MFGWISDKFKDLFVDRRALDNNDVRSYFFDGVKEIMNKETGNKVRIDIEDAINKCLWLGALDDRDPSTNLNTITMSELKGCEGTLGEVRILVLPKTINESFFRRDFPEVSKEMGNLEHIYYVADGADDALNGLTLVKGEPNHYILEKGKEIPEKDKGATTIEIAPCPSEITDAISRLNESIKAINGVERY